MICWNVPNNIYQHHATIRQFINNDCLILVIKLGRSKCRSELKLDLLKNNAKLGNSSFSHLLISVMNLWPHGKDLSLLFSIENYFQSLISSENRSMIKSKHKLQISSLRANLKSLLRQLTGKQVAPQTSIRLQDIYNEYICHESPCANSTARLPPTSYSGVYTVHIWSLRRLFLKCTLNTKHVCINLFVNIFIEKRNKIRSKRTVSTRPSSDALVASKLKQRQEEKHEYKS